MLKKSGIPVIFFHIGDTYAYGDQRFMFVDVALRQAALAAPNSDVILLTDEIRQLDFDVTQVLTAGYSESVAAFEKVYIHTSVNERPYELNCYTRWFVMRDFARQHGLGRFCVFDTDILLFSPVERFAAEFGAHRAGNWTWANVFADPEALALMCDYFSEAFADAALFARIADRVERRLGRRQLSDMQVLRELPGQNPAFLDQSAFPARGYDHSIRDSENGLFVMDGAHKYLTFGPDGVPLARRRADGATVPFHFLHFQGGHATRPLMLKFAWQSRAKEAEQVRRNALCPCGSGKRFKHCHGRA